MSVGADAESPIGYKYCLLYAYERQEGTYDLFKYYTGWWTWLEITDYLSSVKAILWASSRIIK